MACTVPKSPDSPRDTAKAILDVSQRLVQERGFNAFSFRDVAGELRITTASLHYHYATKGALGSELIQRYASSFYAALAQIEAKKAPARAKLRAYADLYLAVLRERRMCLCGMLAAEYETLPRPMQEAISGFLERNDAWLAGVLDEGRRDGSLAGTGSPRTRRA
jgi:TetR/AcrR family transcriptional repressor of nem operon